MIHGIAGEIGALRDYHHGQVCGRLLLPFLALLESSEQPQQRALMAELAARLYPHWQGSPESYLTDFITRHAIAPFWQNDLPISRQELAVALEKSTAKFLDRLCAGTAATDDRRGVSRRMMISTLNSWRGIPAARGGSPGAYSSQ